MPCTDSVRGDVGTASIEGVNDPSLDKKWAFLHPGFEGPAASEFQAWLGRSRWPGFRIIGVRQSVLPAYHLHQGPHPEVASTPNLPVVLVSVGMFLQVLLINSQRWMALLYRVADSLSDPVREPPGW